MTGHDEREDYDDQPFKRQLADESTVRGPASALWVVALVQSICTVLAFPFGLLLFGPWAPDGPDDWRDLLQNQGFLNLVAICVAGVVSNVCIMRGAREMRGFGRYWWAVTAAVLAAFGMPCIYLAPLTLPVGGWAFVVLLRPDVRARFAAVACGTMTKAPPVAPDARAD